jgi:periplasmic protein TonB
VLTATDTVSSLSSGDPEAIEPLSPDALEPITETIEPIEQSNLEPVETETLSTRPPETLSAATVEPLEQILTTTETAAVDTVAIQPLQAAAPEQVTPSQAPTPVASEVLEPVETQTLVTPPAMPTPLSQRPPDAPRPPPRPEPVRPAVEPRPAAPGNRGNSNADSQASAGSATPQSSSNGSGGDAEVARYPSQVIGKLRSAMRQGGRRGEVLVRFTVTANGGLAGISISRSSGDSEVDAAGVAIVQRAAPFPPIPAAAGRSSWTFDIPLAFGN